MASLVFSCAAVRETFVHGLGERNDLIGRSTICPRERSKTRKIEDLTGSGSPGRSVLTKQRDGGIVLWRQ
jgi:hypothetical protein